MKKLTFCLILTVFAAMTAAQAADCCDTTQKVSAKKTKAMASSKTAATCSSEKSACHAKKTIVKIDYTVRGATLLAQH